MIDRTHPLPVMRQCQLLGVARSTATINRGQYQSQCLR
jgi:hypothetical protein